MCRVAHRSLLDLRCARTPAIQIWRNGVAKTSDEPGRGSGLLVDTGDQIRLPTLIKLARNRKGLTQGQLGSAVGVSRYTINRIEAGTQDIANLAGKLALELELPELLEFGGDTILHTNGRGRERGASGHFPRDDALDHLLSAPGVDRLVIVLADEVGIVDLLAKHHLNLPPTVVIIFPTKDRQLELRAPLRRTVPTWNVQAQINQIFGELTEGGRLDSRRPGSPDKPETQFKLYESGVLRQSFVLAGSAEGTQCVTWPSIPNVAADDAEAVPAAVSNDSAFIQKIEEHIIDALGDQEELTHLKVVAIAEEDDSGHVRHRFSQFFRLGEENENEFCNVVAGEWQHGFAVALVMLHSIVERKGRAVGRRVLLLVDPKTEKWELFSAHLSDEDLSEKRSPTERLTSTWLQARNDFLREHKDAIVPADAYRRAARRGLLDEYGVDLPLDVFHEIPLPHGLWQIAKVDPTPAVPILPRLYEVNLRETGQESLESAIFDGATSVFAASRHDFQSVSADSYNDFLRISSTEEREWFMKLLDRLEIVDV